MGRIIVINKCGECPECGFNDTHVLKTFGDHYCIITGNDVKVDTIPDNCPLPTEVGRDYEGEIARLKREIRQYRTLYSGHYGKK